MRGRATVLGRRTGRRQLLLRGGLARAFLLALMSFGASGCDDRPSGPGGFILTIDWSGPVDPAGAVALFVSGPGIQGFSGLDGAAVWTNADPDDGGGHRVVIMHGGTPPALRLRVESADRAVRPSMTILAVATQDNLPVPPEGGFSGYRVRVAEAP